MVHKCLCIIFTAINKATIHIIMGLIFNAPYYVFQARTNIDRQITVTFIACLSYIFVFRVFWKLVRIHGMLNEIVHTTRRGAGTNTGSSRPAAAVAMATACILYFLSSRCGCPQHHCPFNQLKYLCQSFFWIPKNGKENYDNLSQSIFIQSKKRGFINKK